MGATGAWTLEEAETQSPGSACRVQGAPPRHGCPWDMMSPGAALCLALRLHAGFIVLTSAWPWRPRGCAGYRGVSGSKVPLLPRVGRVLGPGVVRWGLAGRWPRKQPDAKNKTVSHFTVAHDGFSTSQQGMETHSVGITPGVGRDDLTAARCAPRSPARPQCPLKQHLHPWPGPAWGPSTGRVGQGHRRDTHWTQVPGRQAQGHCT